jgi:multimeric flavodoxin WrbA
MRSELTRRNFLTVAGGGAAVAAGAPAAPEPEKASTLTILGIATSPRKGKTTATAVKAALDAAKTVDPRIKTILLDLGGLEIAGWAGGSKPTAGVTYDDDFEMLLDDLRDPKVAGWVIGSPVYFRSMSALCKAFLERCAVLRKPTLLLADKPVGVLAVGAYRNGGQELVIDQIQTALLCHEMMIVGGKPRAHQGATLWNQENDDITKDTFGMDTAKKLGLRVAEAAVRLAPKR